MRSFERLLRYVKIHTTSDENSGSHPSFVGEFDLAELLVRELLDLGLKDAEVDDKCYVYAHLPASEGFDKAPAIGLIAHMDTSPDACGENVAPQIIEDYDGGDVRLGDGDRILTVDKFPFLKNMIGETLITGDGRTLLGADDKAGIAEIMTVLEQIQSRGIPHGKICVAFTPDEEIGEGADFFDIDRFGADYAYTVDGGDVDCLEYENFNAASAKVVVRGVSVHPGEAKDVMINASNVAMEFHMALPGMMRPEHTEGREGFFHLTDMTGSVSQAKLAYIVRDHDKAKFEEKKQLLRDAAAAINKKYGSRIVTIDIEDSYMNMLEMILPHMHLIDNAGNAIREEGLTPRIVPIRGGTDGARLSFMGLPCPNLGTGGYNFHGEYECITAERMDKAVNIIISILSAYSRHI